MGMRRAALLGLPLLLLAACGDDEPAQVDAAAPSTTVSPVLYEASTTVLESSEHGPQLCLGGVMDSYPPQCGGPDVLGWDWSAVTAESSGGTTWGEYHVVGTWDGGQLTLTEPPGDPQFVESPDIDFSPACDEPEGEPVENPLAFEGFATDIPDLVTLWVSDPAGGDFDGPFTVNVVVLPGGTEAATAAVREAWPGPLCVVEREAPTEQELATVQDEVGDLPDDSPLGQVYSSGSYGQRGVVDVQVAVVTPEAQAFVDERWGELVELHGSLQPVADP